MIDLIVTPTLFTQDGIERTPTDTFEKGYVEKVDDQFFHIELEFSTMPIYLTYASSRNRS